MSLLQDVELPTGLDDFTAFCGELKLEDNFPFVLHEYQAELLSDFFGGCRETIILIPKKNGKTTLIAALALYHMLTTPDCLCVIVASSVKQADICFRQATGFIRRSPHLNRHFLIRPGFKEIRSKEDQGLIQVLAADSDTADGVIPTLAIVDELHRHKNIDLYTVLRDGLPGRKGQMITISTAGDDEESALGKIRTLAHSFTNSVRRGKYAKFMSPNGNFVLHEWALDLEDDRTNMEVVKQANPAPWHTLEALKMRFDSPSTTEWGWARFACNVWYPWGEESAIRPEDWDACFDAEVLIDPTFYVTLGMDLGWKSPTDATAITPEQWVSEDLQILGNPVILVPAGDGTLLDDRAILEALLVMCNKKDFDRREFVHELSGENRMEAVESWADAIEQNAHPYRVEGIVFDPSTGAQQLAQQAERDFNLPFIIFQQRISSLVLADAKFLEAVRRRSLRHTFDKRARAHVLNAVEVPTPGGQFYFGRAKAGPRKPTDALRAASMAHSVLDASNGKPKRDRLKTKGGYAFL